MGGAVKSKHTSTLTLALLLVLVLVGQSDAVAVFALGIVTADALREWGWWP